MAEKKSTASPAIENQDALVDAGFLTPETASLFPNQQPNELLPSTTENQIATELAESDNIENPKHLMTDEELLDRSSDLMDGAEQDAPLIKEAEDIVLANEERKQQAKEIQDAVEIKSESEEQQKILKKQIATEDAIDKVATEQQEQKQAEIDQIQAEINREQEELKNFTMEDIFEGDDAPISKGRAILAIILGGIGAGLTGGPNLGLQAVNATLDRHMEKQKFTARERMSKKQRVYDLLKLQLTKQQQATNNTLKQAQIDKIKNDIDIESRQLQAAQFKEIQNQMLNKKLASAEGLTREEVFNLDPKLQSRALFLSDGKARFATDDQATKKLRDEILPMSKTAIRGLDRLSEMSEETFGGSFDLETRAEAKTLSQSLKGALRLELFGPGVMTDTEQKLADKIIGNPTKIFSLSKLEKIKLNTLKDKLIQGTRDRLKISGIELPDTKNEKMLKQLMKSNPKLKRSEAMSALIEKGFWDNSETGF